ncbi:acetylcholine receptor DEG 3 protein [Trichuris trichiura]|uniref:Acetylcholine receptor DEG 3 protein n=1 Tax=Trichuris trichiura TaxID=36087 RepID=A0A077Z467_TRITR|nr:acetylcholine receptor DEG 3 protein [Trichuris trichiura]
MVDDLFNKSRYNIRVRPVRKITTTTNVSVRMNLYMINDINERSQTVVLYMWTVQIWKDQFLYWNPKLYGGIDSIIVPYHMVWLPDTYLYNGLEMELQKSERRINVILSSQTNHQKIRYLTDTSNTTESATVTFRYPAIYKFTCYMNILYYPFDWQFCRMTFGSWMFDSTQIDYFPYAQDVFLEDYIEHSEWTLVSFKTKRVLKDYQCCVNPFSLLYCDLILARKPWFSLVNLIIPTAIINFVSLFGIFSPTTTTGDRTEKINLGITTLLTMSILLLMVSQEMPTTSDFIPFIGWFYLSVIILISFATLLSTVVIEIQLQARYRKSIPNFWRKVIFETLASRVFIRIPPKLWKVMNHDNRLGFYEHKGRDRHSSQLDQIHSDPYAAVEPLAKTCYYHRAYIKRNEGVKCRDDQQYRYSTLGSSKEDDSFDVPVSTISRQIAEISENVHQIMKLLGQHESQQLLALEWDCVATIIERTLMIVFIFLSLIVITSIVTYGMLKGSFIHFPDDYE